MLHEDAPGRESFPACRALVRPLPCVCHRVARQVALLHERLVAYAAFKRFFSRVDAFVVDQPGLLSERFPAYSTHEWFLPGVNSLVRQPLPVRVKGLVADSAAVLFPDGVAALVLP